MLRFVAAALQFTSASLAYLVVEEESPLGLVGLIGWLLWTLWIVVYGIRLIGANPGRNST